MKRKPYRYLLYLNLRVALAVVRVLPRPFCLALARLVGNLVYTFLGRYRIKTLEHLKTAYGTTKTDEEFKRIAKQVFQNLVPNLCCYQQNISIHFVCLQFRCNMINSLETWRLLKWHVLIAVLLLHT